MPKLKKMFGGYGLRKNRFVVWLINAIKPRRVVADGHVFYLNRNDTAILEAMIAGNYEPEETTKYKSIIHKGDVVLDIGANIGYFTLLFARAVGSSGLVYAFEPDPTNFKLLQKNIETNGYANVKAFNYAVSDSIRKGFLYLNDYNAGDGRIFGSENDRKAVPIEIISLDEKFPELRPNFVKIDTQGAEIGILKGMKNIIKFVPVLSIEYWPYGLNKTGSAGQDLCDLLTKYGFAYKLNPDLYTIKNQQFTNILATK